MNILQICYSYPPSFSGYGKQLSTVNKALLNAKKDTRIKLITAYKNNIKNDERFSVYSIFPFNRPKSNKIEKFIFYCFCIILPLYLLRFKSYSDVIHVVKAGPEAAAATKMAKIMGIPIIIKVAQDEIDYDLEKVSYFRKKRIKILQSASYFVSLSNKIKIDLLRIGVSKKKIVHIKNSVEKEKFKLDKDLSDIRRDLYKENFDKRIYTFVGSICKRKGIEDLLHALLVTKFEKSIHVNLIGPDYKDIPNFLELINTVNSLDNVSISLVGKVDNAIPYISASDYFILPSYSEGMPNVILEALSCGIPCVASNIPVCTEIVSNDDGVIFDLGDIKSLSAALLDIDNKSWDRKYISENAIKKYSSETICSHYYDLYERAINEIF
ncbi:glycosyltransferase family 4 protein [Vibrio fluvialis]|nr:glycosyltransferase family 4 protein [Vibrio fluvialis]